MAETASADLLMLLHHAGLLLHLILVGFAVGGALLLCLFEIFRGEEIAHLERLVSPRIAPALILAIIAGLAPLLLLPVLHPLAYHQGGALLGVWRLAILLPLSVGLTLSHLQSMESFRRLPGVFRFPVRLLGLLALTSVGALWAIARRVGEEATLWSARARDLPLEGLVREALPGIGLFLGVSLLLGAIGSVWLLEGEQRRARLSPGERFRAEETLLRLALLVAVGLVIAAEVLRARSGSPLGAPGWLLRGGLLLLLAGLVTQLQRVGPGRTIASIGALVSLAAGLLLREKRRQALLAAGGGLDRTVAAAAGDAEGRTVFLFALGLSTLGILAVLRSLRRDAPPPPTEEKTRIEVLS